MFGRTVQSDNLYPFLDEMEGFEATGTAAEVPVARGHWPPPHLSTNEEEESPATMDSVEHYGHIAPEPTADPAPFQTVATEQGPIFRAADIMDEQIEDIEAQTPDEASIAREDPVADTEVGEQPRDAEDQVEVVLMPNGQTIEDYINEPFDDDYARDDEQILVNNAHEYLPARDELDGADPLDGAESFPAVQDPDTELYEPYNLEAEIAESQEAGHAAEISPSGAEILSTIPDYTRPSTSEYEAPETSPTSGYVQASPTSSSLFGFGNGNGVTSTGFGNTAEPPTSDPTSPGPSPAYVPLTMPPPSNQMFSNSATTTTNSNAFSPTQIFTSAPTNPSYTSRPSSYNPSSYSHVSNSYTPIPYVPPAHQPTPCTRPPTHAPIPPPTAPPSITTSPAAPFQFLSSQPHPQHSSRPPSSSLGQFLNESRDDSSSSSDADSNASTEYLPISPVDDEQTIPRNATSSGPASVPPATGSYSQNPPPLGSYPEMLPPGTRPVRHAVSRIGKLAARGVGRGAIGASAVPAVAAAPASLGFDFNAAVGAESWVGSGVGFGFRAEAVVMEDSGRGGDRMAREGGGGGGNGGWGAGGEADMDAQGTEADVDSDLDSASESDSDSELSDVDENVIAEGEALLAERARETGLAEHATGVVEAGSGSAKKQREKKHYGGGKGRKKRKGKGKGKKARRAEKQRDFEKLMAQVRKERGVGGVMKESGSGTGAKLVGMVVGVVTVVVVVVAVVVVEVEG